MEALEIVMAIYKLNTDRGFDAPSPLPFLSTGQRMSIDNYLSLALQGWQNSWVLPEPYYIRAASTAGIDYDSKIFRGGKKEMIDRYTVFERR